MTSATEQSICKSYARILRAQASFSTGLSYACVYIYAHRTHREAV